ncbi:hypothetical protein JTE90_004688 [Oedothorax gibbosus]|uniref:Uncharacterized protein n=1 Tax=Oedothorax gibbosus TaxID=931172 RepID=A0AAV6UAJ4_9ARAC|nr:hypothetical protein JTE90_004688 [Oedothorax gibbosus]
MSLNFDDWRAQAKTNFGQVGVVSECGNPECPRGVGAIVCPAVNKPCLRRPKSEFTSRGVKSDLLYVSSALFARPPLRARFTCSSMSITPPPPLDEFSQFLEHSWTLSFNEFSQKMKKPD